MGKKINVKIQIVLCFHDETRMQKIFLWFFDCVFLFYKTNHAFCIQLTSDCVHLTNVVIVVTVTKIVTRRVKVGSENWNVKKFVTRTTSKYNPQNHRHSVERDVLDTVSVWGYIDTALMTSYAQSVSRSHSHSQYLDEQD